MSAFFFILGVLSPYVGCLLLGAGAYVGWWSPLFAYGLCFLALLIRPNSKFGGLWRLTQAVLIGVLLCSVGILVGHFLLSLLPQALSVFVSVAVLGVVGSWVLLTHFRPEVLRRLGAPKFVPRARRRWALLLSALAVSFFQGAPEATPESFVDEALGEIGLEVAGQVHAVDRLPQGLSSVFRETRYLTLAAGQGESKDVYLIRLRHDHRGRPSRLVGIFNLSETAAADEFDLQVQGNWAAWRVSSRPDEQHAEVIHLVGESPVRGRDWDVRGRTQRWLTNLQETGQGTGIARIVLTPVSAELPDSMQLGAINLDLTVSGKTLSWPLGSASADSLAVLPVPPPRPGSLTTWAVDRVRAIPWIGSNGLQWIKAVVYRIAAEAEDVGESISRSDPETQVTEELGDVWSRLPTVEESPISNWPPAPLPPRLSPALPGEGQWIDLTHEKAFSPLESSAMLFTFVRVDPKRDYNQVSIALWDPRRIDLHMVAGTEEPKSTLGQRGTGLIPRDAAHLTGLVAAFNGAFQSVHGEFGMMENRVVQLPPKPFAATVSTHEDGRTRMGTWPEAPTAIPPDMIGFRQNMTPLVAGGELNPYRRHWWGGVPEGWKDETRTVRSGLCRTKEGYLAYFYSPGIDPDRLGQAMILARCDYGIHLDMNGGHAGFELYHVKPDDQLPGLSRPRDDVWEATGKVPDLDGYSFNARLLVRQMPLMNFPRYIQLTPRDFFYLTRRVLLPSGNVRAREGSEVSAFLPLDTAENDFPPFVVVAQWTRGGKNPENVLRLDPRQLSAQGSTKVVGQTEIGEGERGLYWLSSRFVISKEAPPSATLIVRGGDAGQELFCIDKEGFLMVFPWHRDPSPEWLTALGCVDQLWADKKAGLVFGDQAKDAPVSLSRAPEAFAGSLYPETPVVSPARWGIPQARRAELVTVDAPP